MTGERHIVALSGGVGGAKLAAGLADVLRADQLAIVANTGDDFEYLGLHVSPDIDSLLYALAGINDTVRGWGRAGESWTFMSELERLGADTWFSLGDRDLAVHVCRSSSLKSGRTLSDTTRDLAARLGVEVPIMPMSDQRVSTMLETDAGVLPFQEYFVRRKCEAIVSAIRFDGAAEASPLPAVIDSLQDPALAGVVICPSNPFLSIDPILSVPGVRDAIHCCAAPVVAVSPIVQGRAVKGPTARLMSELGMPVSASSVADYYGTLIDGFVLDTVDASLAPAISETGTTVEVTNTIMRSAGDRSALAGKVLELIGRLTRRSP